MVKQIDMVKQMHMVKQVDLVKQVDMGNQVDMVKEVDMDRVLVVEVGFEMAAVVVEARYIVADLTAKIAAASSLPNDWII